MGTGRPVHTDTEPTGAWFLSLYTPGELYTEIVRLAPTWTCVIIMGFEPVPPTHEADTLTPVPTPVQGRMFVNLHIMIWRPSACQPMQR